MEVEEREVEVKRSGKMGEALGSRGRSRRRRAGKKRDPGSWEQRRRSQEQSGWSQTDTVTREGEFLLFSHREHQLLHSPRHQNLKETHQFPVSAE